MAALEQFLERHLGIEFDAVTALHARHKHMLLVGNAIFVVVDDLLIAIEREAVFNVAAHVKYRDGFAGGRDLSQFFGQRPRRVGAIEEMNHALGGGDFGNAEERPDAVNEQHQNHEHPAGGRPQPGHAKALGDDEDQQARSDGGQCWRRRWRAWAARARLCATNHGSSRTMMVMVPQTAACPKRIQRLRPGLRRRKR